MKLLNSSVTQAWGRKVLVLKKNSPHIFFAGGVLGAVGATVLACRATLKLEPTLDEIKEDIQVAKAFNLNLDRVEQNQEMGRVYLKSTVKIVKLYGPSAVLGAVSIGALTGSHIQMTRRNTALTVLAAALHKSFEEYRLRVQEEIGEGRELDLYRGAEEVEVETEDGRKKLVKNYNPPGFSVYARLFEESNHNWEPHNETNMLFLKANEAYANQKLQARGHVTLNDVYDSLGLARSQEGFVVGWVINGDGDNYIDFGLGDVSAGEFIAGNELNVWLDFNVDGVVYDLIEG